MVIDCNRIKRKLSTSIFGNRLDCFNSINSTNTYILNMARQGAPEGLVVVADFQTGGRGRLNRNWFSPQGTNLLFSLLLKPQENIEDVQKITLATATVLAEGIESYLKSKGIKPPQIDVKWPNDLLINGRKVSGILAESILQDKSISSLAIGCGINVNIEASEFPEEISKSATSLRQVIGEKLQREDILIHILEKFELAYEIWERSNYAHVVDDWKKRCRQFGKPITVISALTEVEAVFFDVSEKGYLLYKTSDGTVKKLVSGEIRC